MPSKQGSVLSFEDLKREVIDPGLCTRCGGCAAACPVQCIGHGPDGMFLDGQCIRCGICSSICPGKGIDLGAFEERLFGTKNGGSVQGHVLRRYDLVASDREVFRRGYFGGRVSALLAHMIGNGSIDAALLTDFPDSPGVLSVGSARIARNRAEVLDLAGSKYLFSPVLSLLRVIGTDPTVRRAAIVCLPCQAHALRMIESDPRTSHLVSKVHLVIGLNCGGVNLDEAGWREVVGTLTGIAPKEISHVETRKVSGRVLEFKVTDLNSRTVAKRIPFSRYSRSILLHGVWDRCTTCLDYSCRLSDLTFGAPIIRSRRGISAVEAAIKVGSLRRAGLKRRIAQRALDLFAGGGKTISARYRIRRRRRKGLPHPVYDRAPTRHG